MEISVEPAVVEGWQEVLEIADFFDVVFQPGVRHRFRHDDPWQSIAVEKGPAQKRIHAPSIRAWIVLHGNQTVYSAGVFPVFDGYKVRTRWTDRSGGTGAVHGKNKPTWYTVISAASR